MNGPTRALALEAVRKVMAGDKRVTKIVERWRHKYPEIVVQAFTDFIEENS